MIVAVRGLVLVFRTNIYMTRSISDAIRPLGSVELKWWWWWWWWWLCCLHSFCLCVVFKFGSFVVSATSHVEAVPLFQQTLQSNAGRKSVCVHARVRALRCAATHVASRLGQCIKYIVTKALFCSQDTGSCSFLRRRWTQHSLHD
jgi:hypothetical protein